MHYAFIEQLAHKGTHLPSVTHTRDKLQNTTDESYSQEQQIIHTRQRGQKVHDDFLSVYSSNLHMCNHQ